MEYIERTVWTFTVPIFILGIFRIIGAIFFFYYSVGVVDTCQRWAVLILFPIGAAVDTVLAIRMWKEARTWKG